MGNFLSIGERLRSERERLGLSQSAFADAAGVTRKTLFGYERGDRAPDAGALAVWAKMGLDVLYVVTGDRANVPLTAHLEERSKDGGSSNLALTQGLTGEQPSQSERPNPSLTTGLATQAAPSSLSRDEEILLDNYRHTPPDFRRFVIDAAFVASQRKTAKGSK